MTTVNKRQTIFGRCRLLERDDLVDIAVADGRIYAVAPAGADWSQNGTETEVVDVGGRVVIPPLVEAHIHLDKAWLASRLPEAHSLAEAIFYTKEAKKSFTYDDMYDRALKTCRQMFLYGTGYARCHVEVDPVVGLKGLQVMTDIAKRLAGLIDFQLVAFPQDGITQVPGTAELLREALEQGAQVVGAVPYNDPDPDRHLDIVFELAREFDVDVDVHIDFSDSPQDRDILRLIRVIRRFGWENRVTVGHLTALGALPVGEAEPIMREMQAVGIGVVSLPATDMYLNGRTGKGTRFRGLTPIRDLRRQGIMVAVASNNVRNAFTPSGTANLLDMANLAAHATQAGTRSEVMGMLDAVGAEAARLVGLADYGILPGHPADLLVYDCLDPVDLVWERPAPSRIYRHGRLVFSRRWQVDEDAWPEPAGVAALDWEGETSWR